MRALNGGSVWRGRLRANLLKRKALARARRAQARDAEQEPEQFFLTRGSMGVRPI